ncbi:MAG: ion channel [Gaiellales bacterium]
MKPGRGLEVATWLAQPGRYLAVLVLTLMSFLFLAAGPDEDWAPLVAIAIQGATLLLALSTSRVNPRLIRLARALVLLSLVVAAATLFASSTDSRAAGYVANGLLVALAPPAIAAGLVRQMRAQGGVTAQTVFGALSIYVLLGMFFATVYLAVNQLTGEPFFTSEPSPTPPDFQYFSFVTLTTTGYGDLTAASNLGRTLAISEALLGQIYLVTVVAALVANIQRRDIRGHDPGRTG